MAQERKMLPPEKKSFRFKASFLPCFIFEMLGNDLDATQLELAEIYLRTSKLFTGSSVIIDLTKLPENETPDFSGLKALFQKYGLLPVGIRGGNVAQQKKAEEFGLPVINHAGKASSLELISESAVSAEVKESNEPVEANEPNESLEAQAQQPKETTKLISTPIRSGMQYYAKDGDLVVTSQVSHGAELAASGHIHVYGTLRGRAMAGACGNRDARIFCRALEAELISIAGYYLTREEILPPPDSNGMIQIYLEDETLVVKPL